MTSLADQVLALHNGIQEVFILEDRGGDNVVVCEATRSGMTVLADSMDRAAKHGVFGPIVVFGAAGQFSGMQTKLVGVAYEKAGLVFAPFDDNKSLALSTSPETLYEVMKSTSEALLRLKELARETHRKTGAIVSAGQAEESARFFLVGKLRASARIRVDEVTYRAADQRWGVFGSCQSRLWSYPRRFQVEVDSSDGSVKRFAYSSSSRLLVVEVACLIVAGLLTLMFYVFWR